MVIPFAMHPCVHGLLDGTPCFENDIAPCLVRAPVMGEPGRGATGTGDRAVISR